jgi:ABC-2 type transport system permease protein
MTGVLEAAWVIARRDFVATVFSRSFILFLLAPMLALGFGVMISGVTAEADMQAQQPRVGMIADPATARAVQAAHVRLLEPLGRSGLPELEILDAEPDPRVQAERLLASSETNFSAILIGTLERPILVGPETATERVGKRVALMVEEARNANALRAASVTPPPITLARVVTQESSGSRYMVRHALSRAGQALIFFITLILAGMLLSNLVEEKSNKVIEVLAAAVPLDAVFLGKLIGMLGISLVGIAIWGSIGGMGLWILRDFISAPVTPALGWPAYCLLVILYFTTNYMLLGAVFLGIGGQATNVREVQTLSMPVTFIQVAIFLLASSVVGDEGGTMTMVGAIFPLSSPLTMIALAAQTSTIWIHFAALVWQAAWVWLFIRISARLFRRTVLKSGKGSPFFPTLFRRSAKAPPSE